MMHLTQKQTPRYKYFLALPLLAVVFFTFSCQTEEELEKEAIAATYDDVQTQLQKVDRQLKTMSLKYFDNYDAARNSIAKSLKEQGELINPKELELELWEETVSSSVYKKVKSLFDRRVALREKLAELPDAEGVFMMVDHQPEPAGGIKDFYSYIGQNLKYPQEARQAGVQGKVFIQFVVDEYGELTEFKSLKGIGHGCDEEAIRVLQGAEAWNPGTTDGKPVKVRMVLPITFKLDDGKAYEKPETEGLSEADQPESNLEEIVAVGYVK